MYALILFVSIYTVGGPLVMPEPYYTEAECIKAGRAEAAKPHALNEPTVTFVGCVRLANSR